MEIRKIDFYFIMAIVILVFFILGVYVGKQQLINQMREVGVQTLCNLL